MTKRSRNSRACPLFAALTLAAHTLLGQTPDFQGVRGISPTGLYYVSNLDTIDPVSGNLMLRIPITAHAPVRGGFTSDLSLVYNSNLFDLVPDGSGGYELQDGGGWQYAYQYYWRHDTMPSGQCRSRFYLTFPDGSHHTLHLYSDSTDLGDGLSLTNGQYGQIFNVTCTGTPTTSNGPFTYHTSDGTFIKVVVYPGTTTQAFSWTAYFPDGRVLQSSAGGTTLTDRNGSAVYIQNLLGTNSVTTVLSDGIDTSRDVQITYHASAPAPYTFRDTIAQNGAGSPNNQPGSASLVWTVNYRTIPASTLKYTCPAKDGLNCPVPSGGTQVDSIVFPSFDGSTQQFQFGYDTDSSSSGGFGQLNLVIPPTAPAACNRSSYLTVSCPYFSYTYQGANANLSSLGPDRQQSRVTQKLQVWVEDQTQMPHTDKWQYQYQGSPVVSPTTIINPDGGQEVINWSYHSNANCSAHGPQLIDKIVHPDQSTEEKVWQQNMPAYSGECDPGNFYVATDYRSVSNGNAATAVAGKVYSYDKNGNVTEVDEYGFTGYTSPPALSGTLIRSTVNTYQCLGITPCTNSASNTADSATAYWRPATNPSPATAPMLLSLVKRKEIDDWSGLGPGSATEFTYDSNGNVLNQYSWNSTIPGGKPALSGLGPSNSSWRHFLYDGHGNLTDNTDPLCTTTKYFYDTNSLYTTSFTEDYRGDSVGCTPQGTKMTRTTTVQNELWSGLEKSRTDYNGVTRSMTYDPLGRTTSVTDSAGGQTLHVAKSFYSDANRRVTRCSDLRNPGDLGIVTVTAYDQLGRVNATGSLESGNPNPSQCLDTAPSGILTDTRYLSGTGASYKLASNPHRSTSDATMGWTLTTMDLNGRVTSVASYDGSTPPAPWGNNSTITGNTKTSYGATSSAETWTVSDQIATRALTLDALSRLTSVTEAGTATTSYNYDGLDNLQSATQSGLATLPGQTGVTQPCSAALSRCFSYDSLKRLMWATNPESGTTSYLYDPNGNLTSKTDARGVTTTLGYDSLSRLTGKTYNDGITPAVTYNYGPATTACPSPAFPAGTTSFAIGRLISVSSSVSSYSFDCYDALGRVLHASQTTNSQSYPFTLAYNAAGSVSSETYPSGRAVKYTYDNAGRTATVVNGNSNASYATIPTSPSGYAANGAISSLTFGSNLVESTNFNHRFQPIGIQAQYQGTTLLSLAYYYCPTQQSSCSSNNGNVQSQTITRTLGTQTQTWNQTYSYTDGMNRLNGATETGPGTGWTESYGFDNMSNRWIANAPSPGLPPPTSEVPQAATWYQANNLTNNRINLWNYDNAGNILSVPSMQRTFSYDAEGRQVTATISVNGTATTTKYSYDGDGRRITKSVGGAGPTMYVYDPKGQLMAEYGTPTGSDSGTVYLTPDTLGSTRLKTDSTGATKACYDYLPFGGEVSSGIDGRPSPCFAPAPDSFDLKFTSKERDAETGLDYFEARYFSGVQGRFTSPDPLQANLIRVLNPQRWNKYAYVVNNPLAFTDPNGKDAIAVGFKTLAVGFGHAAVISVHTDGSATFGSYGPRGGAKPVYPGEYVVQGLATKVVFGSDGTPTAESFAALTKEVAGLENVDPTSVDMDYFKTSDAETAAMDQYLSSVNGTKSLYVVGFHDCVEVCNNALRKAGIGRGSELFDIPRFLIWSYSTFADSTYSGQTADKKQNDRKRDKPDVHSIFTPCKEGDPNCSK